MGNDQFVSGRVGGDYQGTSPSRSAKVPVGPPGCGYWAAGSRAGLSDEAAARRPGTSLRTYRRRVAELMAALEAGSRFQAGYERASSA
jgi:hypothetical protein